jgi:hypothetical protein
MKALTVIALNILTIASLQIEVLAASCWRNTTCTGPAEAAFPGPRDPSPGMSFPC